MITHGLAARLAVMVDIVMAMRQKEPDNPTPSLDPRLAADWVLLGYVVGWDHVVRAGQKDTTKGVNYGVLLRSKQDSKRYVLVIRGTNGLVEWIEDIQATPTHAGMGLVHRGFYGIYTSFRLATPDGAIIPGPFNVAVVSCLGTFRNGEWLEIIGHSLGGPLSTYTAGAIALAGIPPVHIALCCPKPGDDTFARWYDDLMSRVGGEYLVIDYVADVVPRNPPVGYAHLLKRYVIDHDNALTVIKPSLGCNHHAMSIALMLDPSAAVGMNDYGCTVPAHP